MISNGDYLKDLLYRYQVNFDISENYRLGNVTYPAYAYFHSFSEKYVLRKEAQLWAVNAFEHVFFITENELHKATLDSVRKHITEVIEPQLVRKGRKYPQKDHMCSYITFVILTDGALSDEVKKEVKKFRFDKGYMFNFRGHSEARLAVVSMKSEEIVTNPNAKDMKKLLQDVFDKQGRKEISPSSGEIAC